MLYAFLVKFFRKLSCTSNIVMYIRREIDYPNLPIVKQLYALFVD